MTDATSYAIVIPARYGSSRFPGKMLAPLVDGTPMVLHTWQRACESRASEVVIATDDDRIADTCRSAGALVEMTDESHPSGTDRIAEVASHRGWPAEQIIVGLQGDEPATPPEWLDLLAHNLSQHAEADMATLAVPIESRADYLDPNRVKLVTDTHGMALYFSRAPIPWRRDNQDEHSFPEALLHLGLYAYRRSFLAGYSSMPPARIEEEEKLEQLRVLYAGGRIHVGSVAGHAQGVDHPDDVAGAERALIKLTHKRTQQRMSGKS